MSLFIGEEFKEKIIPHAVDFFTGKALEYEDYEDGSDFDEVYFYTNVQQNIRFLIFWYLG